MVHACPPLGVRSSTYSGNLKLSSHNPPEIGHHFARIDERLLFPDFKMQVRAGSTACLADEDDGVSSAELKARERCVTGPG
ncbi:hypothetical protein DSECCO2_350860 [anaerobic digester metagenome]